MPNFDHYFSSARARPQLDPFLVHHLSVARTELELLKERRPRSTVAAEAISWPRRPFFADLSPADKERTPTYWLAAITAAALLLGAALNASGWLS